VADDPTPAITEQERNVLDEHQFALAKAAEVVKNCVANYNACLAELQEVAAPIVARLRADYGAGSPASVSLAALIGDLEGIASMRALNVALLGLNDTLPPPVRD
jgi:mevalonate kinase